MKTDPEPAPIEEYLSKIRAAKDPTAKSTIATEMVLHRLWPMTQKYNIGWGLWLLNVKEQTKDSA